MLYLRSQINLTVSSDSATTIVRQIVVEAGAKLSGRQTAQLLSNIPCYIPDIVTDTNITTQH